MPEYSEDHARSSLGPARKSRDFLPPEDSPTLRVRETSARDGMGRDSDCRSDQWNIPAIDLVPAVSSVSALLPAQHGSLQGQVTGRTGECCEASVAPHQDHAHQFQVPGGVVNE